MFRKSCVFVFIMFSILLFACNKPEDTEEIQIDTTAPIFINLVNGEYLTIEHSIGEEVDLLEGVRAIDDLSDTVEISIIDDGDYDPNSPGEYTITIEAKDEAGNRATITRRVMVVNETTTPEITFDAIVIGHRYTEYVYNNPTALMYTSSGTSFRTSDVVQVMSKEFFIEQYEHHKTGHTNNAQVPHLPNGVIIVVDEDMNVKLVRVAAHPMEVGASGVVKSSNLSWTNSIDAVNGGGNFKGLIDELDDLIPNGGYILFTGSSGEQNAKRFLIQNFFYSGYQGGLVNAEQFNVDFNTINMELKEMGDRDQKEPTYRIVKEDMVFDGIPLSIYYMDDHVEKPILFFFHGFGSNRNTGIMGRGEILASKGFFVIAIDAYLHGDRQPDFFKELSYGDKQKEIVNITIRTAEDAMLLYHKYFKHWDFVNPDSVFAYGVSLGGAVSFYLATIMEELTTFATILSSPSFYEFYQYKQAQYNWPKDAYYHYNLEYYKLVDPLIHYEQLTGKNIFMAGGERDTVVPLDYAQRLSEKLSSPHVIFRSYDTAHSSTQAMQEEAYQFLLDHK